MNLLKRFREEWQDALALWWILRITTAQAIYCYEFGSFAGSLRELANENLMPAHLVAGYSHGFRFDLVPADSGYTLTAVETALDCVFWSSTQDHALRLMPCVRPGRKLNSFNVLLEWHRIHDELEEESSQENHAASIGGLTENFSGEFYEHRTD